MSKASKIDELSTPRASSTDPLQLLQDQLQDLLLIHLQQLWLEGTLGEKMSYEKLVNLDTEWPSLYLKKLQYVYGEKSGVKSSMRFNCIVGTDQEQDEGDVHLSVELNVRNATCSQKPWAQSAQSQADY